MNHTIETNDDLQGMLARSFNFLQLPRGQQISKRVPRPKHDAEWYKAIRAKGIGRCCPTCDVRMRRRKYEGDPNSSTVEHVVPLAIGGDNNPGGEFPNCIAMCFACNQARNQVVKAYGKTIGIVKFLIEQVYCKGSRLAEKYLSVYRKHVASFKKRKPRGQQLPLKPVTTSRSTVTHALKTIDQVSKYDLTHRSSVATLYQNFDEAWRDQEAVHVSHVHNSVLNGWFPVHEGRGRVQYRSKKKVKKWMKLFLSGQVSHDEFLGSFITNRS